jgi:hypothetical protein
MRIRKVPSWRTTRRILRAEPDYYDPFAPDPRSTEPVGCLHCGQIYPENEVKWETKGDGLWVCKYWPECQGAGVGFDIFRVADHPELLSS